MSKYDEKKTALKLINKYAESYNLLEEENKSLRTEVKDLKANLKINKEIIEGFFNSSTKSDKNILYINKLREENSKLNNQLEKLSKEREDLRDKLIYLEQTSSEAINREKEENEKNKNKLFIMDNALIKKDSIIQGLKKKLEKSGDDMNNYDREIYIIEPSVAVTQINDELFMYKQIYENLSAHVKEKAEAITRYESVINDLQNENLKLRTQIKSYNVSNKDNNNSKRRSASTNVETDVIAHGKKLYTTGNTNEINIPAVDLNKLKNKLKINDDSNNMNNQNNLLKNSVKNSTQNEEWIEILKLSGLTPEELDRLGRNKMMSRIIEAIEMLNRLLCDKNLQIRLLEQENENLNQKNISLNKENISLFQQSMELKKELQKYMSIKPTEGNDASMINNTSRITINNLNINKIATKNPKIKSRNSNSKTYERNCKTEVNYNSNIEVKKLSHFKNQDSGSDDSDGEDDKKSNSTVEHLEKTETNKKSSQTIDSIIKNSNSGEESSGHDSIIYTKDLNNMKNVIKLITKDQVNHKEMRFDTLESCTSSEFRAGLGINEESFISQGNNDIGNLNIDIKNSNV